MTTTSAKSCQVITKKDRPCELPAFRQLEGRRVCRTHAAQIKRGKSFLFCEDMLCIKLTWEKFLGMDGKPVLIPLKNGIAYSYGATMSRGSTFAIGINDSVLMMLHATKDSECRGSFIPPCDMEVNLLFHLPNDGWIRAPFIEQGNVTIAYDPIAEDKVT